MNWTIVKKPYNILSFFIAVTLLFAACRRDEDYSSWDTEMLTPIASSSLTIDNLVQNASVNQNPDSTLQLVFDYPIYTSNITDFFKVPDTTIQGTVSLQTLQLSDQVLTQSRELGEIYPIIKPFHNSQASIPAQNITTIPPTDIDASSLFETAVLNSGFMDITITNGFPVDIEEVNFDLVNKVTGSILVSDKMTNITAGSSKTVTSDLSGKQVDASLEVRISSLKTYASNGNVLINIYDKVDITIRVYDLKPRSATAIFPAQSVHTRDENVAYNFDGAELKKLKLKSGILRLRIVSTIEEAMTLDYKIPHATKNGVSIDETLKVAAAPRGKTSDIIRDIPLDGYTIDLRGKNPSVDNLVNSFWNLLDVRLDSSGIKRSISLSDSVYIFYGLVNMVPEWAEGYFGQRNLKAGPTSEKISIFGNNSGTISFSNMDVELTITNGVGAAADIDIKNLTAKNTLNGKSVKLTATPLDNPISMPAATDNPFTEQTRKYILDNNNSNINAFINTTPNTLEYEVDVITNPIGNISNWGDFIYDKSKLEASLKVSTPLSFTAENLQLTDTLPFEMFSSGNLNRVKEGTFNVIVNNSFPLSANLQLYIIDDAGTVIDSVMLPQNSLVQAAPLDPNTGKTTTPTRSVLKAYFSRERMDMVKNAKRLLVKATFNTPQGVSNPINIYSYYKFDLKLTGDFVYEQRF
jgi:hypothetical protein